MKFQTKSCLNTTWKTVSVVSGYPVKKHSHFGLKLILFFEDLLSCETQGGHCKDAKVDTIATVTRLLLEQLTKCTHCLLLICQLRNGPKF